MVLILVRACVAGLGDYTGFSYSSICLDLCIYSLAELELKTYS